MPKFKKAGQHGGPNKKAGPGSRREEPPKATSFRCATCYSRVPKGKKCTQDHYKLAQANGLPMTLGMIEKLRRAWNRFEFDYVDTVAGGSLSRVYDQIQIDYKKEAA